MDARDPRVVVMGVSGSGKTSIGLLLAARLGVPFIDADDLHSAEAKATMAAGTPLIDQDRWPWLGRVADAIAGSAASVTACSALKRSYRDDLRAGAPDLQFVELDVPREVLAERMTRRPGHFMPASLLDSQLATLEPLESDEPGVRVDASGSEEDIVTGILFALKAV